MKQTLYTQTLVCTFSFSFLFSIHFLWPWQGDFIGDHFFYSRNLYVWFRGNILQINLMLVTLRGLKLVFFLFSSQLKANKGKVICVGPKRTPVTQKQNVWLIMVWRSVVVTMVTKVTVSNAKVSDGHTVMHSYFRQDFLVFFASLSLSPDSFLRYWIYLS